MSTYISYFTAPRYAAANRTLISRFTRAVAQSQNWLNGVRNEKEATRILTRYLKIDDTLAAQTYRYMLADGKAYRGEAKVDGLGLAEMIRGGQCDTADGTLAVLCFGIALKKLRSAKYVRAKIHRGGYERYSEVGKTRASKSWIN